jgi:hypothetical protein
VSLSRPRAGHCACWSSLARLGHGKLPRSRLSPPEVCQDQRGPRECATLPKGPLSDFSEAYRMPLTAPHPIIRTGETPTQRPTWLSVALPTNSSPCWDEGRVDPGRPAAMGWEPGPVSRLCRYRPHLIAHPLPLASLPTLPRLRVTPGGPRFPHMLQEGGCFFHHPLFPLPRSPAFTRDHSPSSSAHLAHEWHPPWGRMRHSQMPTTRPPTSR